MKDDMTASESCALKLVKLCASPGKRASMYGFHGMRDASGNDYWQLFRSLQKKGKIHIGKADHDKAMITIL